jgi:predicted outer membrane repeat protein
MNWLQGKCLLLVILGLSVFGICGVLRGDTWYVSSSGGDFSTIQGALNDAGVVDGDVIVVAEGRYYENIDFQGKAVTLRSTDPANPAVVAVTIIDGGTPSDPTLASVVTFRNGEDVETVLSGFTITNGRGKYSGTSSFGGGVYCTSASPTIENCVIEANSVNYYGGGMFCILGSAPVLRNCIVRNNSATYQGGGIYCNHSDITLDNCLIESNQSKDGAGLYVYYTDQGIIAQTIIQANNATANGGGIYARNSYLLMNGAIVTGNTAVTGGGMYMYFLSNGTFKNCIVTVPVRRCCIIVFWWGIMRRCRAAGCVVFRRVMSRCETVLSG